MKVTLLAAISLDGFITKQDKPGSAFTSREDKRYFSQAVLDFDSLIFGAGNYRQSARWIQDHLRPEQLKVVLTRSPAQLADEQEAGKLEFTNESPRELVRKLDARGYQNVCLLGGGQIYGLFLAEGLVDELWLTLEPVLFGEGTKLAERKLDFRGELLSVEKLNPSTLLLKYRPRKGKSAS